MRSIEIPVADGSLRARPAVAPRGMLGQEPGMLPQPVVDHWAARAPALRAELVDGTNHTRSS